MIYAMSDIHGQYAAYLSMLELIHFSPGDTLYIIGDVIDRGEYGIEILQDIMKRDNVTLLRGNHEQLMINEIASRAKRDGTQNLWRSNGGIPTEEAYYKLPREQRQAILQFLLKTPLELFVKVEGLRYHLVHAKPSISERDRLWKRFEPWEIFHFKSKHGIVVFGHTPTSYYNLEAKGNPLQILYGCNVIGIDCGCAHGKLPGRLACLCLDNWQEYYCEM